jgi:hypothetical protein
MVHLRNEITLESWKIRDRARQVVRNLVVKAYLRSNIGCVCSGWQQLKKCDVRGSSEASMRIDYVDNRGTGGILS